MLNLNYWNLSKQNNIYLSTCFFSGTRNSFLRVTKKKIIFRPTDKLEIFFKIYYNIIKFISL